MSLHSRQILSIIGIVTKTGKGDVLNPEKKIVKLAKEKGEREENVKEVNGLTISKLMRVVRSGLKRNLLTVRITTCY